MSTEERRLESTVRRHPTYVRVGWMEGEEGDDRTITPGCSRTERLLETFVSAADAVPRGRLHGTNERRMKVA